jgi:hypothetical protein
LSLRRALVALLVLVALAAAGYLLLDNFFRSHRRSYRHQTITPYDRS